MATGTITHTLTDPNDDPIPDVRVDAYLTVLPASRVSDTTSVVPPETVVSDGDGLWSIDLEQTANLAPAGTQWVIHQRIPAAKGGAQFTMVSVIAGTRTLTAATITTHTPVAPADYYTAAQIDAILAILVMDAVEEALDTVVEGIVDDAVDEALIPIDARLDVVESDIDDLADVDVVLDGRLDAVEATNTTQGSDITVLDGRLDGVEADNSTQDADITALDGRLDTAESGIVVLDGRLDTAESDIDDLGTALTSGLAGKLDTTDARVLPSPVGQTNGRVAKISSDAWVVGTDDDGPVDSVNGLTGTVVLGATDVGAASATDPKLSVQAAGTASIRALGTGATDALPGNHASTTNARTPTNHATTHATGGTDPITPTSIGAAIAAWIPTGVYKTANESITNDVFQDDDELFSAVGANEKWFFQLVVFIDGPTAADWKGQLVGPTGSTIQAGSISLHITTTTVSGTLRIDTATGGLFAAGLGATPTVIPIFGTIATGTTAGTVKLQWAQFATNVTASRVLLGSALLLRRIA